MTHKISVIYTTISTQLEAEKLATSAVQAGQAVCVNIIPSALSIYKWKETIEKSNECLMIFKTSKDKVTGLYNWLLKNHPFEVAAIMIAECGTSEAFYEYLNNQT